VPFHALVCPDVVKLAIPPKEQVDPGKLYHYDPCPTNVEILSIPKFGHLLKPGVHSYDFWLKTFPKKLNGPLSEQPAVMGWGLIIHETWDWVVILTAVLISMVLLGVGVVLYAVLAHDASSAFGLGAYLVAIIMLVGTLKYWSWQERET
jgi:hypothetical protein